MSSQAHAIYISYYIRHTPTYDSAASIFAV